MNKQNRNRLRLREQTDGCQSLERVPEDEVKKAKGLSSTDWQSQGSHRGVRCSIGNTVNNIVITSMVAGVLGLSGRSLCKGHDIGDFCVAWAQLPLRKASGKRGPAHRTHTQRPVLPWGIRPALYLAALRLAFC